MRRGKILNKKIIILVILSGFLNLLSFIFDQLVIQSEFKMRDLERKMIITKTKVEGLSYSLNTLQDLSLEIDKASNIYWNELGFNFWSIISFDNQNNNGWTKVFDEQSINLLNNEYSEKLKNLIFNFNNKTEEIYKIFYENFSSGVAHEEIKNEGGYNSLSKLKNLKISNNLLENFNFVLNPERDKLEQDNENFEIYSKIWSSISALARRSSSANELYETSKEYYFKNFYDFFNLIDEYSEKSNTINYFILLSIISQILGILFILILFKELINIRK